MPEEVTRDEFFAAFQDVQEKVAELKNLLAHGTNEAIGETRMEVFRVGEGNDWLAQAFNDFYQEWRRSQKMIQSPLTVFQYPGRVISGAPLPNLVGNPAAKKGEHIDPPRDDWDHSTPPLPPGVLGLAGGSLAPSTGFSLAQLAQGFAAPMAVGATSSAAETRARSIARYVLPLVAFAAMQLEALDANSTGTDDAIAKALKVASAAITEALTQFTPEAPAGA